jgi:hypothetical protein
VSRAVLILSWQENLTKDETPPRWMWALDEDLNEHFQRVKEERDRKYGTGSDDDDDDRHERPSGPMLKNELAQNRGRNLR